MPLASRGQRILWSTYYFLNEFSEQTLVESGLFYLDEKKQTYVERFRGRLIFPINNISGQPIALGGLSLIHISEPTRLLSISYAVFCLKKKK